MSRVRPQVSFNLNSQLERNLYEKIKEIDPDNFSNAAKHIFFAYFFPPGGGSQPIIPSQPESVIVEEPEEQFEELEGLPMF
ncbi:hypothetical protein [Shimazuella kribbensis]|uniref:hypothetical protein n=1 Tax=Shimazuella kribbensis TaxID=139808 RepID=UPI0004238CC6|nr:hypothetical protein [Shimazuella kribbensis]